MKSLFILKKWGGNDGHPKSRSKWRFISFFTIIFLGLSLNISQAQVIVFAGEDHSICSGDELTISDLNPVLQGIDGDAWWETSGDGTFESGIMFDDAVTYIPGPADLNQGEVVLTLYGRAFNPNGPLFSDDVVISIPDFVYLACNDHINFSLDGNCEFLVKVDMLLEGEHPPLNLYTLTIYDEDGIIVPGNILNGSHIGQLMDYSIGNLCDLNSCEGTISVRDYYPPVLTCGTDTVTCLDDTHPDSLGFPLDTTLIDTMYYIGNNKYYLEGWDACNGATLQYQDELFIYNCDSAYQELIIRTWTASDMVGNTSTCHDSIKVERITINDVQLPVSYNNIDSAALQCDGDWIALPNGNPSPESTGSPITGGCSDIVYQYTDTRFEGCGSTFDIYRDWTIMDWCSQELIHWGQIIKVMDNTAPEILCDEELVTIGADLYNCYSETYQVELPVVTDNCGDFVLEVFLYLNGDPAQPGTVTEISGSYFVSKLPLGTHRIEFKATDECNNESFCGYDIEVVDDVLPYAICDEHTQVALGTDGTARMFATSIDDGSFDNCGIEKFEVIKMTDACDLDQDLNWAPYLDFCCEEVGDTIIVSMRVTDIHGNTNVCMVEVLVEDKIPPAIICPPDITISCDFYYNPNALDEYFGKVVTDPLEREEIVIYDYYNNGVVGLDGVAYDNCSVVVDTTVVIDLNECNVGHIYRTFTATDAGGLERTCVQTITVQDPDPFDVDDIIWPLDVEVNGCLEFDTDTTQTGSPIIDDDNCSLVAVSYEDQSFTIVNDACEKIVRTWTVIDWCQFDHNTLEGQWTYKQVIKLQNTVAPEFTSSCEDREICIYGYCDGLVELEATAEDDCTPGEDLIWVWRLDYNDDGIYEDFGTGNIFAEILGEGTYTIHWTVEDKCGNQSDCSYDFTVKDCKLPTPYCISSLTTVVMNNNGMVSVTPEAFDIGSYDNCTADEDLLLSWSPDVNDTLFTVTCDSMGGVPEKTFFLDMWVTDEAGNQDYCSIWLQVQDNFDVCDGNGSGLVLGGTVMLAETSHGMANSAVDMDCSLTEYSAVTSTDNSGNYEFDNLPAGYDYAVEPIITDHNCNKGVSTLDLVFIQRHILGLGLLDSPYKMIAADANNSNSISAADILQIRKVILGVTDDFQGGDCWKYVPTSYNFTNPYAPWGYDTNIEFNDMSQSQYNKDFYAIKVGDVNGSYANFMDGNTVQNRSLVMLSMPDIYLEGNEDNILVPVYASNFEELMGMQFTLETHGSTEITGIKSGLLRVGSDNLVLHDANGSVAAVSWNTAGDVAVERDEALFYLQLNSGKKGMLSEMIRISDDVAEAALYRNFETFDLELDFRIEDADEQQYALGQNRPNPFNNSTEITYTIPVDQEIVLTIFDTNGKLVKQYRETKEKGTHTITVESEELNGYGIYFYTIETDDFVETRKMINLK
jgi:hypothetical protein